MSAEGIRLHAPKNMANAREEIKCLNLIIILVIENILANIASFLINALQRFHNKLIGVLLNADVYFNSSIKCLLNENIERLLDHLLYGFPIIYSQINDKFSLIFICKLNYCIKYCLLYLNYCKKLLSLYCNF